MTVQNILFFFFPQETWLCYFASTHLVSNSNNTTNKMKNLKKFIQNSVCVFGGGGGGPKAKMGSLKQWKPVKSQDSQVFTLVSHLWVWKIYKN